MRYSFLLLILLILQGCEKYNNTDYDQYEIGFNFKNESDLPIHIFMEIKSIKLSTGEYSSHFFEYFDASNKLEPDQSRRVRQNLYFVFAGSGKEDDEVYDYFATISAGREGQVLQTIEGYDLSPKNQELYFIWDGNDLKGK